MIRTPSTRTPSIMGPSGGGTPMSSMGSETHVANTSARYTPNSHISLTPSGINSTPGQEGYGSVHTPLSSQGGSYTPQPMSASDGSHLAHNPTFDINKVSQLMDNMSKDKLQEIMGNLGGINLQQNQSQNNSYGQQYGQNGQRRQYGNPHTPTPKYDSKTPRSQTGGFKEPTLPEASRSRTKKGWTQLATERNRTETDRRFDHRNNDRNGGRDRSGKRDYDRNSRDTRDNRDNRGDNRNNRNQNDYRDSRDNRRDNNNRDRNPENRNLSQTERARFQRSTTPDDADIFD